MGSPPFHTPDHIACPACERSRVLAMQPKISTDLPFAVAAEQWIQARTFRDGRGRARYVAPITLRDYHTYIRALNTFFGSIPLSSIHIGHIREYQEMRANGELGTPTEELFQRFARWHHTTPEKARLDPKLWALIEKRVAAERARHANVSPNKINQEIGTLIRILKRAGLWTTDLQDSYEVLQRELADIPRAMTPPEQEFFLEVAASSARWQFCHWYSVIALRTTAHNKEMRHLRVADLNVYQGVIYIQPLGAKNKYRIRTIPLAPDALWAANQIKNRAAELGALLPQNFLMPLRLSPGNWDVQRPMSNSGIKKPWNELRVAAGVPWLRIHDLRHTAITRLAEAGTPIPVIMSMAGHISTRMLQHYTQISEQAQRIAVQAAYKGRLYGDMRKPPTGAHVCPETVRSHKS